MVEVFVPKFAIRTKAFQEAVEKAKDKLDPSFEISLDELGIPIPSESSPEFTSKVSAKLQDEANKAEERLSKTAYEVVCSQLGLKSNEEVIAHLQKQLETSTPEQLLENLKLLSPQHPNPKQMTDDYRQSLPSSIALTSAMLAIQMQEKWQEDVPQKKVDKIVKVLDEAGQAAYSIDEMKDEAKKEFDSQCKSHFNTFLERAQKSKECLALIKPPKGKKPDIEKYINKMSSISEPIHLFVLHADTIKNDKKRLEIIKAIAKFGGDDCLNKRNRDGNTPLDVAIKKGDFQLAKDFIKAGAKPTPGNVMQIKKHDKENSPLVRIGSGFQKFMDLVMPLPLPKQPEVKSKEPEVKRRQTVSEPNPTKLYRHSLSSDELKRQRSQSAPPVLQTTPSTPLPPTRFSGPSSGQPSTEPSPYLGETSKTMTMAFNRTTEKESKPSSGGPEVAPTTAKNRVN